MDKIWKKFETSEEIVNFLFDGYIHMLETAMGFYDPDFLSDKKDFKKCDSITLSPGAAAAISLAVGIMELLLVCFGKDQVEEMAVDHKCVRWGSAVLDEVLKQDLLGEN